MATLQSPTAATEQEAQSPRKPSTFRLLVADRIAFAAAAYLVLVTLLALTADLLVDAGILHDPVAQNLLGRNMAPLQSSPAGFHLLGTDQLGRDLLARIVFGARISLGIGVATVVVSGVIGITLGLISGYFGGKIDDLIMRLVDIQMGFPQLLLALTILYAAGPSITNLVLILAFTGWMATARVTRSTTLSLKESQFVEAARAIGATHFRVLTAHILPNLVSTLLIILSLEFGRVMLAEAGLSFLGLGVQPPDASWGLMLAQGREYLGSAWWLITFPGLAILMATLSANLLAGWVRGVNDPIYMRRMLSARARKQRRR